MAGYERLICVYADLGNGAQGAGFWIGGMGYGRPRFRDPSLRLRLSLPLPLPDPDMELD